MLTQCAIRPLLVVLLIAGCRDVPPPQPSISTQSSEQLPAIHLHHTSDHLENSPTSLGTQFAVNRDGIVIANVPTNRQMAYAVIDSSGNVVAAAGRVGEGPGEVRGGTIIFAESTFVIASERLVQFDLRGNPTSTTALSFESYPRAYVAPDQLLDITPGSGGIRLGLTSLTSGKFRPLVSSATDTFVANSFGLPLRPDGGTRNPTLGLWSGGFLVGDGWTYRLALYDWSGRPVRSLRREIDPPVLSEARLDREVELTVRSLRLAGRRMDPAATAQLRRTTATAQQRHFAFFRPTGLDGKGRIWVLGVEADSGFADVFSSEHFLGRISLPCAGFSHGWSLAGTWLVLACLPDAPDFAGDAVFKVFRIEG